MLCGIFIVNKRQWNFHENISIWLNCNLFTDRAFLIEMESCNVMRTPVPKLSEKLLHEQEQQHEKQKKWKPLQVKPFWSGNLCEIDNEFNAFRPKQTQFQWVDFSTCNLKWFFFSLLKQHNTSSSWILIFRFHVSFGTIFFFKYQTINRPSSVPLILPIPQWSKYFIFAVAARGAHFVWVMKKNLWVIPQINVQKNTH